MENPTLTREQFIDILLGRAVSKTSTEDNECIGKSINRFLHILFYFVMFYAKVYI